MITHAVISEQLAALAGLLDLKNYSERQLWKTVLRCERYESPLRVIEDVIRGHLYVVRRRAGLHRRYHAVKALELEVCTLAMWIQPSSDRLLECLKQALATLGATPEMIGVAVTAAEEVAQNELRERQRKAAKARRADPLASLLDDMVRRDPEITEKEVIARLRSMDRIGIVVEITDEQVTLALPCGGFKDVLLSGIKDRLYRAKKRRREELSSR